MKKFIKKFVMLMGAGLALNASANPVLPMPPEPALKGEQAKFGEGGGYFTFNEKPAVIISGSVHYPRVPRAYWRDRIKKAKAMGFNCIGTYIFWNAHEKSPGEFDFTGNLDVAEFVRICQEEGMWVIVRPGPYICSEWDFGGIPSWLLKDKDMLIRSGHPDFLKATKRYMKAVGDQLKDLQVTQGGPIIQIQVENEYGQFGRPDNKQDMAYNKAIYQQLKDAGFDAMFIRCDWPVKETIGTAHIDDVYTTMNFGGSAKDAFNFFDKKYPGKPKMCGEYWVGWFDHWGAKHHTKALGPFIKEIDWMLANEVSFNVYMLHGGTNWGFSSGANWSGQYSTDTTSYDYDAPIDEMGRITDKFFIFRDTIQKYLPKDYKLPALPEPTKRIELAEFELNQTASFEQLKKAPVASLKALHMEALGQVQGFAIYTTSTEVTKTGNYTLNFSELKDRAIIMVNGERKAVVDRRKKQSSAKLKLEKGFTKIEILLENMGHLNYSREMMTDRKGLGTVKLNDKELLNWEIFSFPLELNDIKSLEFTDSQKTSALPIFRRGTFQVDEIGDTMLDMQGWGKGMVWVNGINLGRYWGLGPQYTLYMPGCWLNKGENEIVVMDIHPTEHKSVRGVKDPIFGLKVDSDLNYNRKKGETLIVSKSQEIAQGEFPNGDSEQFVEFDSEIQARYICFETLSSHSNDNNAAIAELHLVDSKGKRLDRGDWQIIYADSEEIVAEPAGADNVLDEQPVTFWHTQYQNGSSSHPHQIVIDLGSVKSFKKLRYLPRNGANPGKVKGYKVYSSKERFKGLKK